MFKLRVLIVGSLQIALVVIAFAFVMTLAFEPGEWRRRDWLVDLVPLLLMIIAINAVVQLVRLGRRERHRD
ncbi:hypothetical protein ABZ814_03870 [Micromonospora musae]|uniref:hypothetical protein n=1 Tax=Micromonospora musae TaxID=1894970 RepID=UPI00340C449B